MYYEIKEIKGIKECNENPLCKPMLDIALGLCQYPFKARSDDPEAGAVSDYRYIYDRFKLIQV